MCQNTVFTLADIHVPPPMYMFVCVMHIHTLSTYLHSYYFRF